LDTPSKNRVTPPDTPTRGRITKPAKAEGGRHAGRELVTARVCVRAHVQHLTSGVPRIAGQADMGRAPTNKATAQAHDKALAPFLHEALQRTGDDTWPTPTQEARATRYERQTNRQRREWVQPKRADTGRRGWSGWSGWSYAPVTPFTTPLEISERPMPRPCTACFGFCRDSFACREMMRSSKDSWARERFRNPVKPLADENTPRTPPRTSDPGETHMNEEGGRETKTRGKTGSQHTH
jgi:hypothetical protein